jgi:hypothetical protein
VRIAWRYAGHKGGKVSESLSVFAFVVYCIVAILAFMSIIVVTTGPLMGLELTFVDC